MKNLLKNLFATRSEEPHPAESLLADELAEQNEIQSLRIELETRDRRIAVLSQEIERLHERQKRLAAETAAAQFEALLADLAGPASQIVTQAYLLEQQNKPIQARDVISVARRAVRAAERHGMTFDNQPGEQVGYDSARHAPISESNPPPGHLVTVRFAGVSYQGKMLYKTIVE